MECQRLTRIRKVSVFFGGEAVAVVSSIDKGEWIECIRRLRTRRARLLAVGEGKFTYGKGDTWMNPGCWIGIVLVWHSWGVLFTQSDTSCQVHPVYECHPHHIWASTPLTGLLPCTTALSPSSGSDSPCWAAPLHGHASPSSEDVVLVPGHPSEWVHISYLALSLQ